jgi:hypothetical protein
MAAPRVLIEKEQPMATPLDTDDYLSKPVAREQPGPRCDAVCRLRALRPQEGI